MVMATVWAKLNIVQGVGADILYWIGEVHGTSMECL